jgi:hypothetical protein
LEHIAEARAVWHNATEPTRQRAEAADTELRRRHPGIDLPPLHPKEEHIAAIAAQAGWPKRTDAEAPAGSPDNGCLDIEVASQAAIRARRIIAERHRQARQDADLDSDELMRQRQADALREADARRSTGRQEPMPSRHAERQAQPELELEAG